MNVKTALKDLLVGQHKILAAIAALTSRQYKFESKLNDLEAKMAEFGLKHSALSLDIDDFKECIRSDLIAMNAHLDRLEDQADRLTAEISSGVYQLN